MARNHSSVIVNTGATTDSRTRDQLSYTLPSARAQAMSIYLRFVPLQTRTGYLNILTGGASPRLLQFGTDAGARVVVFEPSAASTHQIAMANGISQVTSQVSYAHNIGDTVELLATIASTGVVQIHRSVNGGAITSGTASGVLNLPDVWSSAILYIGRAQTANAGSSFNAFRNIEIVAGVQTFQSMRVRAGTD